MVRFYSCLTAILTLLFSTSGVVLITFGTTQPIHPGLRGFVEGCEGLPQPCWYGIVPGVTTDSEAERILTARGYERVALQFYTAPAGECDLQLVSSSDITPIVFSMQPRCVSLRIGDVVEVLGLPRYVASYGLSNLHWLTFMDGHTRVGFGQSFWDAVRYMNIEQNNVEDWNRTSWHISMPLQFYCTQGYNVPSC